MRIKNKFNKFVLGLCLAGSLCYEAKAVTYTHFTARFLTGTMLCVSNATLCSIINSNYWNFDYTIGTNVLVGVTNVNGILIKGPMQTVDLLPDGNGDVNPNLAIQFIAGFTNLVVPAPGGNQTPTLGVWTNPTAFFTNAATAITGTNTVVVTIFPIMSADAGGWWDQGATIPLPRSFSFTCIQSNATPIVISTNLPTSFLQGAKGLYAQIGVTNSGGTSQGVIVDALNLVGWKP